MRQRALNLDLRRYRHRRPIVFAVRRLGICEVFSAFSNHNVSAECGCGYCDALVTNAFSRVVSDLSVELVDA